MTDSCLQEPAIKGTPGDSSAITAAARDTDDDVPKQGITNRVIFTMTGLLVSANCGEKALSAQT